MLTGANFKKCKGNGWIKDTTGFMRWEREREGEGWYFLLISESECGVIITKEGDNE